MYEVIIAIIFNTILYKQKSQKFTILLKKRGTMSAL